MRQVLATSEKPDEGASLKGDLVANRPAQHGEPGFQCIQHRAKAGGILNQKINFAIHICQISQLCGEYNPDHGSV
jgi:hypothetical protein